MKLYRVTCEFAPGGSPAEPRTVSVLGLDGLPADIPQGIEPLIAEAARPRPGVPGAVRVLSHTRMPGGDTLLCRTAAPDDAAGPAPARQVTACHLPGGADDLPGRAPIETWRSDLWDTSWTLDGAADAAPRWCDDEHLARFAAEHTERVEPFLADVRRLFSAPAGRQIVIAEHHPETVAHWIALACASLPPALARALTFDLCAVDPGDAPQQILGIGPDSGFARHDETTLNHLYRVHDGLGGPGSPPVAGPDSWAQVAAQVWHTGRAPRAAYTRPTGSAPFDIGPLQDLLYPARPKVPGVIRWVTQPGNAHALGEAGRRLASRAAEPEDDSGVPGGAMRRPGHTPADPAGADPGAGRLTGASPAPLGPAEMATLVACLGVNVREGADSRLGEALAGLGPASGRDEVVMRLVTAIDARLGGPPAEWADLLEVLHAVSPPRERPGGAAADTGRTPQEALEDKVAARLARYLLGPNGPREPAAGVLLDRLPLPVTRLLLDQLAKSDPGGPPRKLRELVTSPAGEWVTAQYAEAPLRLRLVVQAHRLHTNLVGGLRMFLALLELLPTEPECEPWMLRHVWWLTWPQGGPEPAEAVELLASCPHGLIVDAGLDQELARLLTAPNAPVDRQGALARELLAMGAQLSAQQRHLAKVLELCRRVETHDITPQRAINQMDSLLSTRPVPDALRASFTRKLAVRLAEARPDELYDAFVVRHLRGPLQEELLDAYVAEQLTPARRERLVESLVHDHEDAAELFVAWRTDYPSASTAWERAASRLTDEVFGDVVARLRRGTGGDTGGDPVRDIADILDTRDSAQWVRRWHEFVRDRPGPGTAARPPVTD